MSEPYLGEIRLFSNNYAPQGWVFCEGQILPIAQNQALFSLLGTTYGGNGTTTFALPDLRGRVPIHFNSTFPLGSAQGEATHTLTQNEMPQHTHLISGSSTAVNSPNPTGNVWGVTAADVYGPVANAVPMNPGTISNAGGSQPHENMQPYLALNFAIALQGIYPTRN